jgi:ankyrin repeat protein
VKSLIAVLVAVGALSVDLWAGEIHNAAGSGDVEKIKQLLDKNPSLVNQEDYTLLAGLTPLHVAAKSGKTEAVELLLARGANSDPKWSVNGMTPLICAVQENHADIVRLLLAKQANPSSKANGMTALHWAARNGNLEIMKMLLDAGANVNLKDSSGRTPLHEAAANGTKEMAEFLLLKGADVNAKDNKGDSPWNLTVRHPDIAELLRKRGATASEPVADVIVNRGQEFTNTREMIIDPVNDQYPSLRLRDISHPKDSPVILKNPGKPFVFVLPDHGDGDYSLFFQYLDVAGKPQPPLLVRRIVLDRLPPVIKVDSPKNGSTTDQGFVHVLATVFDPDPDDPTHPGIARRISVWMNGERFWNKRGTLIDIPQFNVQDGPNKLTIVAEDEASNRTEAVVQWNVNLGIDKTPPALSDINLVPDRSGKVILPDDPEVEVLGHLDDPMAIVTATVNGNDPIRMTVMTGADIGPMPMFAKSIALNDGENSLVLSAIDGAGNARDYRFTLIRSNRYRCRVTSPDVSNSNRQLTPQPRIVEGYVSALRDPGTKNEAQVVAVFVNDIETTLNSKDADGNVGFRTLRPVPFAWHGFPGALYVRIRSSDGEEY